MHKAYSTNVMVYEGTGHMLVLYSESPDLFIQHSGKTYEATQTKSLGYAKANKIYIEKKLPDLTQGAILLRFFS